MNDSPPSQTSTLTHGLSHITMLQHAFVRGMECTRVLVNLHIDMGRASAPTAMA